MATKDILFNRSFHRQKTHIQERQSIIMLCKCHNISKLIIGCLESSDKNPSGYEWNKRSGETIIYGRL